MSFPTATPTRLPTRAPTLTPTLRLTTTPTPKPTATATPATKTARVTVGLARKAGVGEMVRRAVELAGGFAGLKPGAVVLVKPNVNSNHIHPGTTNPEVVRAVVGLLHAYQPKEIIVADRSNYHYATRAAMEKVGIYQAAAEAGATVLPLDDAEWVKVVPREAVHWSEGFVIPKLLQEVDYVVTLPVVKTHFIASYTMSLKNTVGLIHSASRGLLHSQSEPDFGSMLAEINLARPADFVVMDGTRAFIDGGPSTGTLREPNLILATPDLIAADVTGLALLKQLGTTERRVADKSPWAQPQIKRAVALALGVTGPDQFSLAADGVPEIGEIEKLVQQ